MAPVEVVISALPPPIAMMLEGSPGSWVGVGMKLVLIGSLDAWRKKATRTQDRTEVTRVRALVQYGRLRRTP